MNTRNSDPQSRLIPLNKLKKSPRNVRQMPHSGTQIEALADSIEAHGLIQNLVVETEKNKDEKPTGFYLVTAGEGRRLAQLLRVKHKQIKADEPIRCVIDDTRDPVALSLAENEIRERMHPADQFAAFKRLVDGGASIEAVAAQFGVAPLSVQRRLKLANVCPELIAAYRDGQASLEQLMALAVTDDHDRQKAVWDGAKGYERDPSQLRQALTESEIELRAPEAQYVGLKAYLKAGGHVRRDLFATEEDEGYITDPELLRRLALEKLERQAKKLRAEGAAWVHVAPHLTYEERAAFGRVQRVRREPTGEESAKLDALESRLEQIDAARAEFDEEDARADELSTEADDIEEQRAELQDTLYVASAEQQAIAGAWVTIGSDGKCEIKRDLLKPEDAKRFAKASNGKDVDGKPRGERTHSAPLMQRLTAHRTLALQATLIQRPEIAFVALVHRLALETFFNAGHWHGNAVQIDVNKAKAEAYVSDEGPCKASTLLAEAGERWRSMLPGTSDALFAWLLGQPHGQLQSLCAYCVALTVNGVTSNEDGDALDALAHVTQLDLRDWWTTTVDGYLSRIPKSRVLDAVREATSPEIAATLTSLKKGELAKAAEQRLSGTGWLPAPLQVRSN